MILFFIIAPSFRRTLGNLPDYFGYSDLGKSSLYVDSLNTSDPVSIDFSWRFCYLASTSRREGSRNPTDRRKNSGNPFLFGGIWDTEKKSIWPRRENKRPRWREIPGYIEDSSPL